MDKEKTRLARLAAITTQLQSKKRITATELAAKHGISLRTIYRDIKTLKASGIPIITEEGKGYTMMDGYTLPPIMFTEAEANALVTTEQLLIHNTDHSLIKQYQNAMLKVKAVLKNTQKEKLSLLEDRIQVRSKNKLVYSEYLMELQMALTDYRVVMLNYRSLTNIYSERKIEPFAIYSTEGNWLLIAFCRLRQDFRAFRLDHIERLIITTDYFTPHEISLQDYFEACRKKYLETLDTPLTVPSTKFVPNQNNKTMELVQRKEFQLIGIKVRTSNHGQAAILTMRVIIWHLMTLF